MNWAETEANSDSKNFGLKKLTEILGQTLGQIRMGPFDLSLSGKKTPTDIQMPLTLIEEETDPVS